MTNLAIATLGVGLRPMRPLSLDLLYHRYEQDQASRTFHELDIDDDPSGESPELGDELDLVLGYEPGRRFELRLTAGWFRPGAAFDDDARDTMAIRVQSKFRF